MEERRGGKGQKLETCKTVFGSLSSLRLKIGRINLQNCQSMFEKTSLERPRQVSRLESC